MRKRLVVVYLFLILSIVLLVMANLFAGSSNIGFSQMLAILFDYNNIREILFGNDASNVLGVIIWEIRIPRLIEAAFLGGALALSGYLLQSFFANPIAGPYVLGISSGAKFFVAVLMVFSCKWFFPLSSIAMVMASFVGSLAAALLVILVARRVRNMSILIVCGVMIGYVCSAATELIVAFAEDSNIVNLHNWSMGSFGAATWSNLEIICPVVVLGLVAALLLSKQITAYLFGESYASSVGMNVKRFRLLLIVVSSLLSAIVTAYAGPISFVGIAVPHVIRSVCKNAGTRTMIVASFLGGASACLLCDLLARCMFAPVELSVSTITAVFGAPIVIVMLLRRKRVEG